MKINAVYKKMRRRGRITFSLSILRSCFPGENIFPPSVNSSPAAVLISSHILLFHFHLQNGSLSYRNWDILPLLRSVKTGNRTFRSNKSLNITLQHYIKFSRIFHYFSLRKYKRFYLSPERPRSRPISGYDIYRPGVECF